MLSKIKIGIAAAGAFIMAILYALLQKEKKERADEHAQIAESSAKTDKKVTQAVIDGAKRQDDIQNEDIDTTRRDHFS